jgi:hypothetical protein
MKGMVAYPRPLKNVRSHLAKQLFLPCPQSSAASEAQASISVVDVGNHSRSRSACLLTSRMDPRRASGRRDRRSGSFQGSVLRLGDLGRVLGHCPWPDRDVRRAAQRAVLGMSATVGIGLARGLVRGFDRSLRIRFPASTRRMVARRTPDLYSRD